MDKLWAPWRIKYIQAKKSKGCIFCRKPRQKKDALNYIITRKRYCFSLLNIFPYNNGHMMVAPYRHVADFEKLRPEEKMDILELISESIAKLKKVLKPQGINVGINLGKAAGAGIAKHLHVHIVPRWDADTNFMPVISQTKVISQSLDDLYSILRTEK